MKNFRAIPPCPDPLQTFLNTLLITLGLCLIAAVALNYWVSTL